MILYSDKYQIIATRQPNEELSDFIFLNPINNLNSGSIFDIKYTINLCGTDTSEHELYVNYNLEKNIDIAQVDYYIISFNSQNYINDVTVKVSNGNLSLNDVSTYYQYAEYCNNALTIHIRGKISDDAISDNQFRLSLLPMFGNFTDLSQSATYTFTVSVEYFIT